MTEFIFADFNSPYAIAFAIVLMLGLIEGIGVVIGLSLLNILDDIFDFEPDVDLEPNITSGGMTSLLGWLCLHKLPFLVWLVLMLTGFSIGGLTANYLSLVQLTLTPSFYISLPIALLSMSYFTKLLGNQIAKVMPKNESSATSVNEFVGMQARITIGVATKGNPAEAVLQDNYNQKHYVMVEPDTQEEKFPQGTTIVLLAKQENVWLAARLETL